MVYCPHDTPWNQIWNIDVLVAQCRMRLLSEEVVRILQDRLTEYQEAHKYENIVRHVLWRPSADEIWSAANKTITNCQLIEVLDSSSVELRTFEKQFYLYNAKTESVVSVSISRRLLCDCRDKVSTYASASPF